MVKSFKRISLVGFLVYNFGFSAQSFAQNRPLKKVVWGQTALSASMWIPWLAKEAKIYERNGLDVEIVLLRGSGQSSQALLGGSIFAAPVALPQLMLANLNGADFVNVAHTIASAMSKLLVRPEIRRPEDLRGKRVATFEHRLAGRFPVSLRAAQVRFKSRSRDHVDIDRHQRRTVAGAFYRCHRRRRCDLSRRCPGGT